MFSALRMIDYRRVVVLFEPSKMGKIPVNSSLDSVLICSLLHPAVSGRVLNPNEFWSSDLS